MYDGNRNCIGKAELRKTLYVEFMKHKQQLKIFWGRKAQYEPVLTQNISRRVLSIANLLHEFRQARVSRDDS